MSDNAIRARVTCNALYQRLQNRYDTRVRGTLNPIMASVYSGKFYRFFQFIALKAVYGNDQGTDMSPGYVTDSIWHAVILDTQLYDEIQRTCGRRIIHHPDRALDIPVTITRRHLMTEYMIGRVFHDWYKEGFPQFVAKHGKSITQSLKSEPSLGC